MSSAGGGGGEPAPQCHGKSRAVKTDPHEFGGFALNSRGPLESSPEQVMAERQCLGMATGYGAGGTTPFGGDANQEASHLSAFTPRELEYLSGSAPIGAHRHR